MLSVLERDPRCKMITLDPDTAEPHAELLRTVTKGHAGTAGVYSAVLVEGTVARGDKIELLVTFSLPWGTRWPTFALHPFVM